jgi:hypothetical protein
VKKIILLALMLCGVAQADCGSETVTWPVDVNKNCGAQIWSNSGAQAGSTQIVTDPVNIGSDAVFKCDGTSWQFISGTCTSNQNY